MTRYLVEFMIDVAPGVPYTGGSVEYSSTAPLDAHWSIARDYYPEVERQIRAKLNGQGAPAGRVGIHKVTALT